MKTINFRKLNASISQTLDLDGLLIKIDASRYRPHCQVLLLDNGEKQVKVQLTQRGAGPMVYCPKCKKTFYKLAAHELVCYHCSKEVNVGTRAKRNVIRKLKSLKAKIMTPKIPSDVEKTSKLIAGQAHYAATEHRALVMMRAMGREADFVTLFDNPDFGNKIGTVELVVKAQHLSDVLIACTKTSQDKQKDAPIAATAAAKVMDIELQARIFYDKKFGGPDKPRPQTIDEEPKETKAPKELKKA